MATTARVLGFAQGKPMTGSIEHVMDTAFWVASDRALEGERADALFRDPLAAVLAGEKGRRIAESMPNRRAMVFVMGGGGGGHRPLDCFGA